MYFMHLYYQPFREISIIVIHPKAKTIDWFSTKETFIWILIKILFVLDTNSQKRLGFYDSEEIFMFIHHVHYWYVKGGQLFMISLALLKYE